MPVEMKLTRIIMSEIQEQQVIYLKEVEGERQFPILIGLFEATSIDRRVKGERPYATVDSRSAGAHHREGWAGSWTAWWSTSCADHIYFAKLRIRHNGELIEIDARPSDAIAVAVTCDPHLPIYVAEEVLDEG